MQEKNMNVRQHIPFAMVDSKLLMSEEINHYEKVVYCVLCAYANNNDRSCYPSYETIARKAGCSRSKVIKVIASLETKGLVEKQERLNDKGENKSNLYVIKPFSETGIKTDGLCTTPYDTQEIPPHSPCGTLPNAPETLPGTGRTPELDLKNYTQNNYIHPSVYQDNNLETDRLTELKKRIDYEFFENNYPDNILIIDSLLIYILELYSESPAYEIKFLDSIDSLKIMGFLDYTVGKCYAEIKNFKAYYKKMLLEYLKEERLLVSTAGIF